MEDREHDDPPREVAIEDAEGEPAQRRASNPPERLRIETRLLADAEKDVLQGGEKPMSEARLLHLVPIERVGDLACRDL